MFLQLLLSLALVIVGIQLVRGKWLMLIAGYNTSSKEQRSQVNGPRLGKLMGTLLLFCSLAIVLTMLVPRLATFIAILILISVLFAIIFANSSKLFDA